MGKSTVAVLGGGPWGLALAASAARAGTRTLLVSRRETNVVPQGVELARSAPDALSEAGLVIVTVPSTSMVEVLQGLKGSFKEDHVVIHGVRGLVGSSLQTVSDVVQKETSVRHVGALGGPALAQDMLAGTPSILVVGTNGDEVGYAFTQAFVTPSLRVYTTSDLRGVEWSSALVGCLAIVVGYAYRLGLGAGSCAAVITRGVREVALMVKTAGGAMQTPLGLAGYGDLLAYVSSRDRPEVRLGAALATGMTIQEAAKSIPQRVEGVDLVPAVVHWAREQKLRIPIFEAMAGGIFGGTPPDEVIRGVMTLPVEDPG